MHTAEALRLLGLRSMPADMAALQKAWRASAAINHPDRGGTAEKFKIAGNARAHLTAALEEVKQKSSYSDNIPLHKITLTLEQLLAEVTVTLPGGKCGVCTAGFQDIPEPVECPECGGTGQVGIKKGIITSWKTCNQCGGKGTVTQIRCLVCDGLGNSNQGENSVVLPRWAEDGEALTLKSRSGSTVQVILKLIMPAGLRRKGADIMKDADIPYDVLCLGGTAETEIPGHGIYSFTLNPLLYPGHIISVPDKGLPDRNGGYGRAYLKLTVEMPGRITADMERVLKEWSRVR